MSSFIGAQSGPATGAVPAQARDSDTYSLASSVHQDALESHTAAPADYRIRDPHLVHAAEVAALDASAAANATAAEASLRRTTQEAHEALQTAHLVTTRLSTQTEKLSAVEEAQRVNMAEWRQGRREMRRTRHWYAALGHWLRCGGAATFRGVATKGAGGALTSGPAPDKPTHKPGHGTALSEKAASAAKTTADEPVCKERRSSQGISREPSVVGEGVSGTTQGEAPHRGVATRSSRLRGALEKEGRVDSGEGRPRADAELCARLEPGVVEVRQLVKEMHEQALLHNELLTAHNERLDDMNGQAEKTIAKNRRVVERR